MNRNQRSTTVTVTARPASSSAPARRRRTRANGRQNSSRNSRRTNSSTINHRSLQLHPDVVGYIRCLTDPFRYPPVPLGFGCMTASQVCTLTVRTTISAGADGHVSAYVIPSVNYSNAATGGGLFWSNSVGGAALASTQIIWQNNNSVGNLLEEARIVSCGLRATPMIPGTASPGGAFVASLPSVSCASLEARSKSQLISLPLFEWGLASDGCTVCSRPVDPDSFTFHHDLIVGLNLADDAPVTIPVIVMNGLPAGTSVLLEAVLQVEGLYGVGAQSQAVRSLQSANAASAENGITRTFPSVESMWNTVSRYLPSAATVRTAASLANQLLLSPGTQARMEASEAATMRYLPSTVRGRLMP